MEPGTRDNQAERGCFHLIPNISCKRISGLNTNIQYPIPNTQYRITNRYSPTAIKQIFTGIITPERRGHAQISDFDRPT